MRRHWIEQVVVMAIGFALGVTLAICIAPRDTLLAVVSGVVFSIFAREFFEQTFGGEWFWPFSRPHGKRKVGSKSTTSHR